MFFALGNALLDSSIAVWECKRFYDYVRPITAVRFLKAGKKVHAWAGPYQGTQLIPGETFQSYIPTPPFAEYVSGHSTFSAASAEILKSVAGSDTFGGSSAGSTSRAATSTRAPWAGRSACWCGRRRAPTSTAPPRPEPAPLSSGHPR